MFRSTILILSLLVFVTAICCEENGNSIIEKFKDRHEEAVKNAEELVKKLQTLPHTQYMIVRVQMALRYANNSYTEVKHLTRNQLKWTIDHFVGKYVEALKMLENTIQEIQNGLH